MPELKLYYFHPDAKVLVSRLVLAVAKVDYEFVQVERSKWPELKHKTVFGKLPVLKIDGKQYGQSIAIQAYLAREYDLYGSNNIERLQIDQFIQLRDDFEKESHRGGPRERDPAKEAENEKRLKENVYPRYLGFFSKTLQENGTGFVVGDKLSLADLVLYEGTSVLASRNADVLQKYPDIIAHRDTIENVPAIKEFLASRGETTRV